MIRPDTANERGQEREPVVNAVRISPWAKRLVPVRSTFFVGCIIVDLDAVGDLDFIAPRAHRLCLQKQILTSVIQHAHHETTL